MKKSQTTLGVIIANASYAKLYDTFLADEVNKTGLCGKWEKKRASHRTEQTWYYLTTLEIS